MLWFSRFSCFLEKVLWWEKCIFRVPVDFQFHSWLRQKFYFNNSFEFEQKSSRVDILPSAVRKWAFLNENRQFKAEIVQFHKNDKFFNQQIFWTKWAFLRKILEFDDNMINNMLLVKITWLKRVMWPQK